MDCENAWDREKQTKGRFWANWKDWEKVWVRDPSRVDAPRPSLVLLFAKTRKLAATPWKTDAVIEHENDIDNLEFTIFKLGEVSAPLKVGIFYPGEKEDECLQKCRDMILKQISSYPGGVYLIIFGFLNEQKGVYWHGYEIDFKGNIVKLHKS